MVTKVKRHAPENLPHVGIFWLLNGKLAIGKRKTMEYAAVANRLEMETNHFLRLFVFQ